MAQIGTNTWFCDINRHNGQKLQSRSSNAIAAYKYRLELWKRPKHSNECSLLSKLAQEILKQFGEESIPVRH